MHACRAWPLAWASASAYTWAQARGYRAAGRKMPALSRAEARVLAGYPGLGSPKGLGQRQGILGLLGLNAASGGRGAAASLVPPPCPEPPALQLPTGELRSSAAAAVGRASAVCLKQPAAAAAVSDTKASAAGASRPRPLAPLPPHSPWATVSRFQLAWLPVHVQSRSVMAASLTTTQLLPKRLQAVGSARG